MSGNPGTLLCHASTGTITPSVGWNSVSISGCPTLSSGTTYWVGYINGSNQIVQGTAPGACPGTSLYSDWTSNGQSSVALPSSFGAFSASTGCYSMYMTLNSVAVSNACGETAQSGLDDYNTQIGWGTPCATGSNPGGYTVSSISYWVGAPTASSNFDLGVYSDSSGNPGTLLCHASTGTITPSAGWNSINISSCPALNPSTQYWVGYVNGNNQILQGTVSGVCPGTSKYSVFSNPAWSSVSLASSFGANISTSSCYSVYMSLSTTSAPVASMPTFSPVGGTYSSAQAVTISDSTSGATVYYTTNGTTPTTSSSVYSGSITVSASETIKAIAAATGYTPSSVASAAYTINQTVTTPTLTVSSSSISSSYGQAVTFTATISAGPTGTITFNDGSNSIGTGSISGTTATLTTSSLAAGNHSITAYWAGNSNYAATTSDNIIQMVSDAAATVSLSNLNQTFSGSALSPTATTSPTGLPVTITYNGSSTPPTAPGSYQVVATVNSGSYQGSAIGTLVISKATPTLGITWSPGSPTHDHPVTLTCNAAANGQPVVNGTILTFAVDGSDTSSDPTSSGSASWATMSLSVGQHDIRCIAGDSNYNNAQTDVYPTISLAYDTGTVSLTVAGSVVASTTYGAGSTPSSVAQGLAAGVVNGALVNITAADDTLYIQSNQSPGAGTDYSYSLQVTNWDSTDFGQPSFTSQPASGTLTGGENSGSGAQTVYSYGATYDGVGNVTNFTDSVLGAWNIPSSGTNVPNGYDTLNRLTMAQSTSGPYSGQYVCWAYDPFGNRTMQVLQNSACTTGMTPAEQYNSNNQFSDGLHGYDAAGNLNADGGTGNTYLYDAEGRICAMKSEPINGTYSMTGYIYNAEGIRVAKGSISNWSCDPVVSNFQPIQDYVLGPSNEQITEMGVGSNGTMVWAHSNVWGGGKLLATYDNDGLHFYLDDPLGSRRVQTDYAGVVEQKCTNLPFGDAETCGPTPTEHLFTGKERDQESQVDYFGARYYSFDMGRFMSPDWSAKGDPVPYGHLDNPQSLNLYAYVMNNPLARIDLDGHGCNGWGCLPEAQTEAAMRLNMTEAQQRQAQQQNGSSKGPGFWGRLGQRLDNFFHGNGLVTNAELEGIGVLTIVPGSVHQVEPEPNPYVSLGLDALGTAAALTGHDAVAKGTALGSGYYDPSPLNLLLNGGSFIPGTFGEAFGPITVVNDVGGLGGGVITNNVMAPMINAIPGNTMSNGNGVSIQTPEAQCVLSGMC